MTHLIIWVVSTAQQKWSVFSAKSILHGYLTICFTFSVPDKLLFIFSCSPSVCFKPPADWIRATFPFSHVFQCRAQIFQVCSSSVTPPFIYLVAFEICPHPRLTDVSPLELMLSDPYHSVFGNLFLRGSHIHSPVQQNQGITLTDAENHWHDYFDSKLQKVCNIKLQGFRLFLAVCVWVGGSGDQRRCRCQSKQQTTEDNKWIISCCFHFFFVSFCGAVWMSVAISCHTLIPSVMWIKVLFSDSSYVSSSMYLSSVRAFLWSSSRNWAR